MSSGAVATAERAAAERAGEPSDHLLVARVRCGDDRSFERLYERYHRRIAAYVYGMVCDYGRAEDITQEVFISALRRMRETERPIAFKPWVYEIAKNACIDQFRRSRRAEEVSYDAEEGLGAADYGRLVSTDAAPDAAMDAKQQLDHLCGAFGGLSESHHQILVLRELEGLSYREIGERMGLSRPSVESTLFRARRRLTEEYDELVSGERCKRIQDLMASIDGAALGTRDARRLSRHISHCQPCRRQARALGVDTKVSPRESLGQGVARRVAAFLPLPFLVRGRGESSSESVVASANAQTHAALTHWSLSLGHLSEGVGASWAKGAAAAATVLVAMTGAGVVTSTTPGDLLGDRSAPSGSVSAAAAGKAGAAAVVTSAVALGRGGRATASPSRPAAAPSRRPAGSAAPAGATPAVTAVETGTVGKTGSSGGSDVAVGIPVASGAGAVVSSSSGALGATGSSSERATPAPPPPGGGKVFDAARDVASGAAGEPGAQAVDDVQDVVNGLPTSGG